MFFERTFKGAVFGCRMCGNCLLQETAFICPMECPKGLRNGPCGGSTPEHCYVDPSRPCIWYRIYARAEKMGRLDRLMEVLPPLDWDKTGTSAVQDLHRHFRSHGGIKALWNWLWKPLDRKKLAWEEFFFELRQPAWWSGDALPHPAPAHEPASNLEKLLGEGRPVVTVEILPPLSNNPDDVIKKVELLKGSVDAANFTDNPSATARMSSLACSLIAMQNGLEPVLQIAARERTRSGFQAEVLGATALGIRNILCLTGDHPNQGPAPHARKDIWDLDSIQMVWLLRRMRDEGHFLDGREIKSALSAFIGAAGSPFASTPLIQAMREEKKVNAGAQFIQTQTIFDADGFEKYLEALDRRDVLQRVRLLVGLSPVRNLKALHAMSQVPGIKIPPAVFNRIENAADPKEESIQFTLETIERIKNLPGVAGFHFMCVGWESIVPRLVQESGLRQ
jgi:methylenetetrahydrofolate reductase (NADPH)